MFLILAFLFILYKILDYIIRLPTISDLDRKKIMVTGCDSGFGRMFATRMANKGVTVFASCMTDAGKNELENSSANIKAFIMDITDVDSVQNGYQFVIGHLGSNEGLWGILNNAGLMQSILGPLEWQSSEDFKKVLDINVVGQHNVTKAFLPLVKMSRGRLVFASSVAGRFPEPAMNLYVASKHALEGYVSCIRADLKLFGISCHLIEPGIYKTPLVDAIYSRVITFMKTMPDDLAKEYPKEYREQHVGYLRELLDKSGSTKCQEVANMYEHALFAVYPRGRYLGIPAIKAVLLLPEYVIDYIVINRFTKPRPDLIYQSSSNKE